jgi:IS1 family transposase
MANILARDKQIAVIKSILTGTSYRMTSWNLGVHRTTCTNLIRRFGTLCEYFMRREMRELDLRHVQCDEIMTHVHRKWWNVDDDDPDAEVVGDMWLFRALDEDSRLIPAHFVGKRNDENTIAFIRQLAGCVKRPRPHKSDRHAYDEGGYTPVIRISTDGWASYPKAIDMAFGPYAEYGRLTKKHYKNKGEKFWRVKQLKKVITGHFSEDDISTSLVERSNGTTRTFLRSLVRKTNGYSRKLENLRALVSAHMCWYNFCWKVSTLNTSPAHEAGICNHRWTVEELFDHVMAL